MNTVYCQILYLNFYAYCNLQNSRHGINLKYQELMTMAIYYNKYLYL